MNDVQILICPGDLPPVIQNIPIGTREANPYHTDVDYSWL